MEFTRLNDSGIDVSRLGFGCCPMGGHGWGDTDDELFRRAVHDALDREINFFDTADIYGLGHSETTLGKALRGRRQDAFIATKFGVRKSSDSQTFFDNSPRWVETALEASLRRLGVEYIDLYQMHYWDGKTPPDVIIATLEQARRAGKIRYFGISNVDPAAWRSAGYPRHLVTFTNEYSLACRQNEEMIMAALRESGLVFISWGSLGQGVLTGKYDAESTFSGDDRRSRPEYVNFHGERLQRNLEIVETMKRIQTFYPGRTLSQIAIRWVLDVLEPCVVLTGIKDPGQLAQNTGALDWKLEKEHIQQLKEASCVTSS